MAHEIAAHKDNGRCLARTTGRHTLNRTLPKYLTDELPEMEYLLDPDVLPGLIDKALAFFNSLTNSELQGEQLWADRVAAIPHARPCGRAPRCRT